MDSADIVVSESPWAVRFGDANGTETIVTETWGKPLLAEDSLLMPETNGQQKRMDSRTVSLIALLVLVAVTLAILLFYPSTRRRLFEQFRRGDSWAIAVGVYIFSLLLLFLLFAWDSESRIERSCLINCRGKLCQLCEQGRGRKYTLVDCTKSNPELFKCLMTGYSFLHMLLYFILGFLTPYLLPWLLLVGFGFELLEKLWECHDQLDIAYNTIGILAGAALRFCLDKPAP